jgi:hypothetical protein
MPRLSIILILIGISTLATAKVVVPLKTNLATSGFYVSAGIGFYSFGAENDTTALGADGVLYDYINQVRNSHQDFAGILSAGYDFPITPTFLLAVEARFLPQASTLQTNSAQTTFDNGLQQIVAQSNTKISLSANSAELLLKPEFLVDTNSYAYALLGTGYTQEKLVSNVNYDTTNSAGTIPLKLSETNLSKTVFPVIYGLGYMQYMIPQLNVFAEVTDSYYPSMSKQTSFDVGAAAPLVIQAASQTVNLLAVTLGLTYHFSGI